MRVLTNLMKFTADWAGTEADPPTGLQSPAKKQYQTRLGRQIGVQIEVTEI